MDWVCSHSKERKYKKTFAREKHGCYPLISSNRPCQNSTGATFSEQNLKKQSWQRLWQKSFAEKGGEAIWRTDRDKVETF